MQIYLPIDIYIQSSTFLSQAQFKLHLFNQLTFEPMTVKITYVQPTDIWTNDSLNYICSTNYISTDVKSGFNNMSSRNTGATDINTRNSSNNWLSH